MTELYKPSLTDRRKALTKHRPVYFARRKRISVRNCSVDGLSHYKYIYPEFWKGGPCQLCRKLDFAGKLFKPVWLD